MIKFLKILFIVVTVVLIAGGAFGFWFYKSGNWKKTVVANVADKVTANENEKNILQTVLGFNGVRNYLILFLNNTELRPGGGFIGAYALLQVDKGNPRLLKVEGTEILDNLGKKDFESVAPNPITKYLKVSRWYFRDSNWSPDFASSSVKGIELFTKQGGADSIGHIDAVIGFTPTVIEEVLKIHGPVMLNGEEFNAANFTEKLEYEVEYGYAKRGQDFAQRKNLMRDLAHSMLSDMRLDVIRHYSQYYDLFNRVLREKQIVFYSLDQREQEIIEQKQWAGLMTRSDNDYLMWVDANMGALKTDAAIKRQLSYSIAPSGTEQFVATAKMKFIHNGKFDWRTSRYRDYARIFVPLGSQLVKSDPNTDQGSDNGLQWFGKFVEVMPGRVGELSFQYYLPSSIVKDIKTGDYKLNIDKQIGTIDPALTLSLDFGKKLVSATPGENPAKYGDGRYDLVTDLRENRGFNVKLTQ